MRPLRRRRREDLGDISTARLLYDAARLAFRNGAGPFRALAKLSFRPRAYQMVPLVMALRQETVRLLIADDVGVGKTIEALLVVKELLERRKIKRFAVVCLPHLCDQWQAEIRAKLDLEAVIIRSNTQARLDRQIQGDTSVLRLLPLPGHLSIDFIKSDTRRDVFIEQCPELVIVDEAHTCARPAGASVSPAAALPPGQSHCQEAAISSSILLTATPHSGKPEEFQSLLGLLRPDFETLDLPASTPGAAPRSGALLCAAQARRRRKVDGRGDALSQSGKPSSGPMTCRPTTCRFFNDISDLSAQDSWPPGPMMTAGQRVHYWTALACCAASCPARPPASRCSTPACPSWRPAATATTRRHSPGRTGRG